MMETLEEIKARLRKLRDAGKDLIEEFAPMLLAEQQEHARTKSNLAQCSEALSRQRAEVLEQYKTINKLNAELAQLRGGQNPS
jgi:hypothetical protein